MKVSRVCIIAILCLALFPPGILRVNAVSSVLYASPIQAPEESIGTFLIIEIKVSDFPLFNGWEVYVRTDPDVLVPREFSRDPNIFTENTTGTLFSFPVVQCVNGSGLGCAAERDGPGIVRSVIAYTQYAEGAGVLFVLTFEVVGQGFSAVSIYHHIIAGQGGGVDHEVMDGTYGSPPASPDFSIVLEPQTVSVAPGESTDANITINSMNSFIGQVLLDAVSFPTPGLNLTIDEASLLVSSNGSNSTTLKISTSQDTLATQYAVTVTAVSGTTSHESSLTVSVSSRKDFLIVSEPGLLFTGSGGTNSSTILMVSLNGYAGNLTLSVGPVPGPIVTLDSKETELLPDQPARVGLTVSVPVEPLPFQYGIIVTATDGSLAHSIEVVVRPPPPDFLFRPEPSSLNADAGTRNPIQLTIASQNYFRGTISLISKAESGIGVKFDPPNFYVGFGESKQSVVTVSVDADRPTGVYTFSLTAFSEPERGGFFTTPLRHTSNITVVLTGMDAVRAPLTIFGLSAPVYFSILAGLWLFVVLGVVFEIRRRRRITINP